MMLLIFFFFLTALVYSSVGFGGGSTYLALLALFNFPYLLMPQVSLICNLIVVSGGVYHHIKTKHFSLRPVFPFIITSIPFAYWGGSILISKRLFLFLLAFSLAMAGTRLLFIKNPPKEKNLPSWKKTVGIGLPAGALLGFISGMVGIGGGIFLVPVLYFLRWGTGHQIAASASFFILVNSLAGLLGHWSKGLFLHGNEWILPLVLAVFIGGQIGSRLSVSKIALYNLQRVTALLILSVSARIFWMFL